MSRFVLKRIHLAALLVSVSFNPVLAAPSIEGIAGDAENRKPVTAKGVALSVEPNSDHGDKTCSELNALLPDQYYVRYTVNIEGADGINLQDVNVINTLLKNFVSQETSYLLVAASIVVSRAGTEPAEFFVPLLSWQAAPETPAVGAGDFAKLQELTAEENKTVNNGAVVVPFIRYDPSDRIAFNFKIYRVNSKDVRVTRTLSTLALAATPFVPAVGGFSNFLDARRASDIDRFIGDSVSSTFNSGLRGEEFALTGFTCEETTEGDVTVVGAPKDNIERFTLTLSRDPGATRSPTEADFDALLKDGKLIFSIEKEYENALLMTDEEIRLAGTLTNVPGIASRKIGDIYLDDSLNISVADTPFTLLAGQQSEIGILVQSSLSDDVRRACGAVDEALARGGLAVTDRIGVIAALLWRNPNLGTVQEACFEPHELSKRELLQTFFVNALRNPEIQATVYNILNEAQTEVEVFADLSKLGVLQKQINEDNIIRIEDNTAESFFSLKEQDNVEILDERFESTSLGVLRLMDLLRHPSVAVHACQSPASPITGATPEQVLYNNYDKEIYEGKKIVTIESIVRSNRTEFSFEDVTEEDVDKYRCIMIMAES